MWQCAPTCSHWRYKVGHPLQTWSVVSSPPFRPWNGERQLRARVGNSKNAPQVTPSWGVHSRYLVWILFHLDKTKNSVQSLTKRQMSRQLYTKKRMKIWELIWMWVHPSLLLPRRSEFIVFYAISLKSEHIAHYKKSKNIVEALRLNDTTCTHKTTTCAHTHFFSSFALISLRCLWTSSRLSGV